MTKKKPPQIRKCIQCDKEYTVRKHWQKFCRPKCRYLHFLEKKIAELKAEDNGTPQHNDEATQKYISDILQ